MVNIRYTQWDGSQKLKLDADKVFEKLAEMLSYTDDIRQAMETGSVITNAKRDIGLVGFGLTHENATRTSRMTMNGKASRMPWQMPYHLYLTIQRQGYWKYWQPAGRRAG